MPWLRVDDGYDTHPKLLKLTELQRWRWTRVLLYCARYKTRGKITVEALVTLGVDAKIRQRLLAVELLHPTENGALQVNDWTTYNPVDPTSAKRKERFRERHGNAEGTAEERKGNGERNGPPARARASADAQPPARGPSPTPTQTPSQPSPGERDEPERLEAWRAYAATVPDVRNIEALAQHGYSQGDWPPKATAEPRTPRPDDTCPDCGEKLGHGHADDCPRTPATAPPLELAADDIRFP